MWICAKCGEPHQDQFLECWKCVGDEMRPRSVEGTQPSPPQLPHREQRQLRSPRSMALLVLSRVAVGFLGGMLLGMAIYHRNGASFADAGVASAIIGAVIGVFAGLIVWIFCPYEPIKSRTDATDQALAARLPDDRLDGDSPA